MRIWPRRRPDDAPQAPAGAALGPGHRRAAGAVPGLVRLVVRQRPVPARRRHDVRAGRRVGPRPLPRPAGHPGRVAVLQGAQGRRQALVLAGRPQPGARRHAQQRPGPPPGPARLRGAAAAGLARRPAAARRGPVAGAVRGRRRARGVRHLPAARPHSHLVRERRRVDEPAPAPVRAAAGGGGPGTGQLRRRPGGHRARSPPRTGGHVQRRVQDRLGGRRLLAQRHPARAAGQGRGVDGLLPRRRPAHRGLGPGRPVTWPATWRASGRT